MKYELTFLLNEEEEIKNLKKLLETLKIKLIKEDNWGKKTLSYLIKKNITANYYNWQLEIDKSNVQAFRKKLDFNEKLIRYLLLKVEE